MKASFWVVLVVLSSSGCTSLATLFVADNACGRENVYCGENHQEERDAAIDIAEEAYEYDKKIYEIITGNPTESSKGKDRVKNITYCEDSEEKVCISTGECRCI